MTESAREIAVRLMPAAVIFGVPDENELERLRGNIERALLAYAEQAKREVREEIANGRLAKKLCEIVDGWGEPRHPKQLGFTAQKAGITCGNIYEFVDAIRAITPPAELSKEKGDG